MANAIPEGCVFFLVSPPPPFYTLLLLTQFLCYSFLSSFLTDDTRSGKVSFDGFFFRVHVHFTVVFLLITTAEEEKKHKNAVPAAGIVGSRNLRELNLKWRQAFGVCARLIRRVSLRMMLALIWHAERVKCQLAPSTFANNQTYAQRVPGASWGGLSWLPFTIKACRRLFAQQ